MKNFGHKYDGAQEQEQMLNMLNIGLGAFLLYLFHKNFGKKMSGGTTWPAWQTLSNYELPPMCMFVLGVLLFVVWCVGLWFDIHKAFYIALVIFSPLLIFGSYFVNKMLKKSKTSETSETSKTSETSNIQKINGP